MKKLKKKVFEINAEKMLSLFATMALFITTVSVNSACWYVMNQDALPKGTKGLRKFD